MERYTYKNLAINAYEMLNLRNTDEVEITNKGDEIIVRRAKSDIEKRNEWVKSTLATIPSFVYFVRDGNVTIAYQGGESQQTSAFTVCSPVTKYDEDLNKCVAFFRLMGWCPPTYATEYQKNG